MLITAEPPRCGRCQRPIRDGEPTEPHLWETASGPPALGVAHTAPCPPDPDEALLLPCTSCLLHLVTGSARDPHGCELTTRVRICGGNLLIGEESGCPCICPAQAESEALTAARAEARDLSAPAHKLAGPPREE